MRETLYIACTYICTAHAARVKTPSAHNPRARCAKTLFRPGSLGGLRIARASERPKRFEWHHHWLWQGRYVLTGPAPELIRPAEILFARRNPNLDAGR